MKDVIHLNIPALPRIAFLLLTAVHLCGVIAALFIVCLRGSVSHVTTFYILLMMLTLPITFALMSVPALLSRYPRWIVRLFGDEYLRRLISDCDVFWKHVQRLFR